MTNQAKINIEHLRKVAERMEQTQAMLADERANLYIAVQALRDIAVWAIRDGNDEMIQSRALDALRLIGKEDARG